MTVINKTAKALYVYDALRQRDYDNGKYTDKQLEQLYDAAETFSIVSNETIWHSLGIILSLTTRLKPNI